MSTIITKYLISIKREAELSNKFVVDTFFPIKLPWEPDDKNCTVTKVANQLAPELGKALEAAIFGIQMRLRYNPQHIGPLIVNWTSEDTLDCETLNTYIGNLNLEEVKKFVEESLIRNLV